MEIAVYNSFIFVFIFKVIPKIFFLFAYYKNKNNKMGGGLMQLVALKAL